MKARKWYIEKMADKRHKDIRTMFKLSDEGARKEIKKLLTLGVVKPHGKGRSIHYGLA